MSPKVYKQVWVNELQTPFQIIIWRPNNIEGVATYKLQTLTWDGVSSLSCCKEQQLAFVARDTFPAVAHMWVGGCVGGKNTWTCVFIVHYVFKLLKVALLRRQCVEELSFAWAQYFALFPYRGYHKSNREITNFMFILIRQSCFERGVTAMLTV